MSDIDIVDIDVPTLLTLDRSKIKSLIIYECVSFFFRFFFIKISIVVHRVDTARTQLTKIDKTKGRFVQLIRSLWPCSLGGIWRNLDESVGICESVNSVFHQRTVNSGWNCEQPNGPYVQNKYIGCI